LDVPRWREAASLYRHGTLENDPQRIRHHGDVLLAVNSTPKQTSKLPPTELGALLGWQMLLD